MPKILVCGGGGFIGGHLTQSLMKNNSLVCADIKPMELWFQQSDKNKNLQLNKYFYHNKSFQSYPNLLHYQIHEL